MVGDVLVLDRESASLGETIPVTTDPFWIGPAIEPEDRHLSGLGRLKVLDLALVDRPKALLRDLRSLCDQSFESGLTQSGL